MIYSNKKNLFYKKIKYCCKEAEEDALMEYLPNAISLLQPLDHCPYCDKKHKRVEV